MKIKNPFADLTKFERCLWLCSVVVIIAATAVSEGDFLAAIASLIGVTALIFVAKGYVIGQVLTVVFAVFYGIISYFFSYYGEMITYLCMTAPIAVFSVISWIRHPFKGSKEVQVNRLNKRRILQLVVSALAVTVVFYFILSALGNANLFVSTISITTSFVASFLSACRSPYYAVGYCANDVVLVILWILAAIEDLSYLPMVMCFLMFLLNDIYGFYNWRRMLIRQNKLQ